MIRFCANCGDEIDLDGVYVYSKGKYFCNENCKDSLEDEEYSDESEDESEDDIIDDLDDESANFFVWTETNDDDLVEWLKKEDEVNEDSVDFIMNELYIYRSQYPDYKIIVKKEENETGFIIEIWDDDRKVKSEFYLFEDIK